MNSTESSEPAGTTGGGTSSDEAREAQGAGAASDEARGALSISLGQASLMVMGGVMALLITQYFGKGAGTDAFFTAYGFYVIAIAFAQTLRLTALPRLMGDVTGEQEGRLLAATGAMALLAAVPMLIFAGPLGGLIAAGDPTGVAAETLRLLWPALACHLIAGVLVPMLTLRSIYTPVGLALMLASGVSVVAFVLLQPELGIKAVPTSLGLSAALLVVSLALTLHGDGWRPRFDAFADVGRMARDCADLTVASASFLIVNVGYLICLAVANHGEQGEATIYAYAFFAAAFLVATTAIPSALVRAPGLLDESGGRGVTANDVVGDFRVALMLVIPAFGLAALIAQPAVDLVAGEFFGSDDATKLTFTLMALAPWVLASIAGVLVVIDLLNRGRAKTLAWIALAQAVALVPLAIIGRELLGIAGIALAQALTMSVATGVQLRSAFGDARPSAARRLSALALEGFTIALVAFGPAAALIALADEPALLVPVLLAGSLALYAAIARIRFEREWRLLTGIAGRGPRTGQ